MIAPRPFSDESTTRPDMQIFIIDEDHRRRAILAFKLSAHAVHAVPLDRGDRLPTRAPAPTLIIAHDPLGDPDLALNLLDHFAGTALLVFYAQDVALRQVISLMQQGALSYFRWPDEVDQLVEHVLQVTRAVTPGDQADAAPGHGSIGSAAATGRSADPNGELRRPDQARLSQAARKIDAKARISALSPREIEVLRLVADGHSSIRIAELLKVSPRTVEAHRSNILAKTGLNSTAQVVRCAFESQIL
ncbi:MAG: LuxR C-terminal-related transcriptional regulator [Pseudomonadota bacterium]|nr:LuxR C-terminal-related transcriptional regulator [Pseudomonadota bacterium]